MFSILLNGFLTGLFLQLAIGPVFIFLLNISLQRSYIDGLFAVLAVTIVDYIYITLAVIGVGRLLEKPKTKLFLGIFSSIILIIFGIFMIISAKQSTTIEPSNTFKGLSYFSSFSSAFILTISSPLTIVFWTSLFSAKAVEKDYTNKQLIFFGIGAGFATLIFLGFSISLVSFAKASIPILVLKILNIAVGSILCIYGFSRIVRHMINPDKKSDNK
jgi:threonine/homoserine/homoserine lactone efflux protein